MKCSASLPGSRGCNARSVNLLKCHLRQILSRHWRAGLAANARGSSPGEFGPSEQSFATAVGGARLPLSELLPRLKSRREPVSVHGSRTALRILASGYCGLDSFGRRSMGFINGP